MICLKAMGSEESLLNILFRATRHYLQTTFRTLHDAVDSYCDIFGYATVL
jgi:hypothetical protein